MNIITLTCRSHLEVEELKSYQLDLKIFFIISSVGQRDVINNEDKYRTDLHYPWIDSMSIELNDRFSSKNLEILGGLSAPCPDNEKFLQIEVLKPWALHMKADFCLLNNEIQVLKEMFIDTKLKSTVDLHVDLLPMKHAFPTTMPLIVAAMAIPISSTTCERTFSKMKLIKTTIRSIMSDIRLNDLCVLAVERDFGINFEKLMDDFANSHKDSRILLK